MTIQTSSRVRVLPPFNVDLPGDYPVVGRNEANGTWTIDTGECLTDFDEALLEEAA